MSISIQVYEGLVVKVANLQSENEGLRAARQSYANLFEGDVGNIHQNIREVKAENEKLKEALHDSISNPKGVVPDSANEFYNPWRYY